VAGPSALNPLSSAAQVWGSLGLRQIAGSVKERVAVNWLWFFGRNHSGVSTNFRYVKIGYHRKIATMKVLQKRHWRILGILAAFFTTGCMFTAMWSSPDSAFKSKYEQIQLGMSVAEVVIVLDCSDRYELVNSDSRGFTNDTPARFPPTDMIWIRIDPLSRKVIAKCYCKPSAETYFEHLANRLCTLVGRSMPFPSSFPSPPKVNGSYSLPFPEISSELSGPP
jgi:hypothetical protein